VERKVLRQVKLIDHNISEAEAQEYVAHPELAQQML
jgi:hypothetical protein